MPDEFHHDVFLSHSAKDKPRVLRLVPVSPLSIVPTKTLRGLLADSNLNSQPACVWLDEWVIQAGDIIALKVDEGLEQSRVLLLVPLSQLSTLNSQPACTAVHRDPANAGRRFIPLLPGDGALPDTLRRCKVVDFREESEAAFAEVLATLRDTLLPKLLNGELSVEAVSQT